MRRILPISIATLIICGVAWAQQIFNNPSGTLFTSTVQFGTAGTFTGKTIYAGTTSGAVTQQVSAAAGTYNFNMPTSAGSAGQPLLSGGGGATAQTYGTLGVGAGGTGAVTPQGAMAALKGVYILGASAVASAVTGTTTETTLATITVPANAMGPNGVLRITPQFGYSGGTSTWTPRIKFNGTAFIDPAAFNNTTLSARMQTQIANRNATNSQVGTGVLQGNWSGVTSAVVTSAHDTTGALNITITGQLANAGDTITLHSYLVELMVP